MRLVDSDDPILGQETTGFDPSEIADAKSMAAEMLDLLDSMNGIGLAAPQVGIAKSLFVISIDGVRKVFINPEILSANDAVLAQEEGCLSLPGLVLKVTRPTEITVTWLDEDGVQQIADLQGLWARCWLHEYDHLKGIMIRDRVSKLALDMAKRKLAKKSRLNGR